MKKFFASSVIVIMGILSLTCGQLIIPDSENYILNENDQQVLNTQGIEDPLRDGAYNIVSPEAGTGIWGLASTDEKISTHQNAQDKTMNVIKNIINYALMMVALVALVYLIYHGFLIITAAGDDTQYKKWLSWVKYAAIAMAGIGVSWLVVSFIFRLIALIIWPLA